MQGCSLHPAPLDTCRKSPLTPPFDLAQGMLFQRGGFFSRERSNSTTLRFIVAALSFLCPLLFAGLCAAHPLGNFSISQYSALRVGQDSITLRYIVDMAEIPTFQEIQETGIIPNGDDPNTQAYLAKKILALRDGLSLEIGGRRLPLHADSKEIIFPAGAGGLPTLKIGVSYTARLPVSANGLKFSLNYRDGNFVGRAGWKEIIVLPAAGAGIENSSVPASDRSAGLSNYPTDLLNTPPQDLEARVRLFNSSCHGNRGRRGKIIIFGRRSHYAGFVYPIARRKYEQRSDIGRTCVCQECRGRSRPSPTQRGDVT